MDKINKSKSIIKERYKRNGVYDCRPRQTQKNRIMKKFINY